MSLISNLISLGFQLMMPPFLFVLTLILFLASFGKSLGIRRLYVRALVRIFEFARSITTEHKKRRESLFQLEDSDDEDEDQGAEDDVDSNNSNSDQQGDSRKVSEEDDLESRRKYLKNFGKESRHNVISRKDNLILSPHRQEVPVIKEEEVPHHMKHWQDRVMHGEAVSVATFRREYELGDILDYIKTGIAAVIEDEVTQRFVAEELKSWNLLTRTSQSFEFVNIRLTVIWIMGFLVRYFVLLPGRIVILVVGITYLLGMTAIVSMIPKQSVRRWLYEYVAVTAFRILSRSFSAVVTFHNRHLKPKSDGICVANHTTPIDVVILQMDRTYALLFWMGICMAFVGRLRDGEFKKWLHFQVYTSCFQLLGGSISAVITYHNPENKPKKGICVANHTSPIDVLVLACDNAYALVGQRHGGFLGAIQRALSRATDHIWFERSEVKDRTLVASRLREHVEDPDKLPILIFPEGTCINNTSVMQFKKGSFEVGGTIYPVAIKYDPKFGDAFWNSSEYGMLHYIYMMMTSWAIVCDVWYLPPMTRKDNEDAVTFANRVKGEIARQGGLVDLMWDGNLKRASVKSEWKALQQHEFSKRLKVE